MFPVPSRTLTALMLIACTGLGAGCKKEQLSLVLVNLKLARPDARASDLKSVTVTANPGPTANYPLSMLSDTTTVELGELGGHLSLLVASA